MNEGVYPQNPEQAREQGEQKNYLSSFVDFNKSIWPKFSRSQKIYYVGIWLGIFTFLIYFTMPRTSFQIWSIITVSVVLCGALSDLLVIYNKIWETKIGKGLILIAYALLVNFAYAISSQAISKMVGFSADTLIYTLNFVAILSVPFFVIMVSFVALGSIIFITHFLAMMLIFILVMAQLIAPKFTQKIKERKVLGNYFFTFIFIRLAAYSMTFGIANGVNSSVLPIYDRYVTKITKEFIYRFEANEQFRCQLEEGQRAIKINDQEIVVVDKKNDQFTFKPQFCIQQFSTQTKNTNQS